MAQKVNLDALIPREDFEVREDAGSQQKTATLQIRDLEHDAFFYLALRKPDFQRETNEWSEGKIADLIGSFLDGDLIPAVILWDAGKYVFVVDGAHRLSALISWVQDDFGDGSISRSFFDQQVPEEQLNIADKTRSAIKNKIGSYKDYKLAAANPDKFPEYANRAKRLASLAVQLQWVVGSADKAEQSFFKINQSAAPINKTEITLLKSRKKPSALAARAVMRSGTGHKYWSEFAPESKKAIEEIAKAINTSLFVPALEVPIKTLDIPIAGRRYSAQSLPLIYDFVNVVNQPTDEKVDSDGAQTLEYLKTCKSIVDRIIGKNPASLGLHPAVYFYSTNNGRFQPTSFLAVIALIKEFEQLDLFRKFTEVRSMFEDLVLSIGDLSNQVTLKHGSGTKGYVQLKDLYLEIINRLASGDAPAEIRKKLGVEPAYSYLRFEARSGADETGVNFSPSTKSAAFLRDALQQALKCKICNGLIHVNSITFDHIHRKQDGGKGNVDNAQLAHPYCNTTFKN